MKSGLVGDDGREEHEHAILTSALLLFCGDVQTDVGRLVAYGQADTETARELFCAAAKRQVLDPTCRASGLQDIVEAVMAAEDGLPDIAQELHPLLEDVMVGYAGARAAHQGGRAAAVAYREGLMIRHTEAIPEVPFEHGASAMGFLAAIERCEMEWSTFQPTRPFELAVHAFVNGMESGSLMVM